mmetsp:Transcript_15839/g.21454  ORF Transcript_15839/g.21454 Transcript_15839/m.21454 type:complete len:88 (-) Transcript_15839:1389-1652(-)
MDVSSRDNDRNTQVKQGHNLKPKLGGCEHDDNDEGGPAHVLQNPIVNGPKVLNFVAFGHLSVLLMHLRLFKLVVIPEHEANRDEWEE